MVALISGLLVSIPVPANAAACVPTSTTIGVDTILAFSTVGSCDWTPPANISTFELLVVGAGGGSLFVDYSAGGNNYYDATNHIFRSNSGGAERMRIDSGGNLLVGTTSSSLSAGAGFKFTNSSTIPNVGQVVNTSASNNTYHYFNENATNNGYRFYVNVNGGVYNFSGNNSNLSDERTKENIELASNYLGKICAIPVKTFNYKDEPTGEQKTLGVIAQDVEAVAPELVNNEGFGETKEGEQPLKSIYTTDIMFAMMKAIQEQQALISDLTTRLTTLEGK